MGPVANEPRWTDQRLVCLSALEFEPKHLRGASFSRCWALAGTHTIAEQRTDQL